MNLWLGIRAAFLLAIISPHPSAAGADMIEAQTGTLVMMIPTRDGLVVAADTRHTLLGVSCDNDSKIYFPKRPAGTVVTVTGTGNFLAVKQPFVSDPCEEIAQSPVLLSIPPIVTAYLEEKNVTAANVQLAELAERCVARLKLLFSNPFLAGQYVGKTVFTVVVGSYDPEKRLSAIRSFTVDLPTATQIAVNTDVDAQYALPNQPDFRVFGQGQYLVDHVLNGVGKQFVDAKYEEFLKKKSISDIDAKFAADVAVNLIEATSKTTELVQIPSGVGGPIDVFLIGSNGPERLR